MFQLRFFSQSDLAVLALVAAIFSFILGLLADIVMRSKGFGPLGNAIMIFAGGLAGIYLRINYIFPSPNMDLLAGLVAAIIAATGTLVIAAVLKRFVRA